MGGWIDWIDGWMDGLDEWVDGLILSGWMD